MVSAEWREARDLLRGRLQVVGQQVGCKNTFDGLLAQYSVTTPSAPPPLVQRRTTVLAEQRTLLTAQPKRLGPELNPLLIPDAGDSATPVHPRHRTHHRLHDLGPSTRS